MTDNSAESFALLMAEYTEAQTEYAKAAEEAERARRALASAVNRVSSTQKALDSHLAKFRSSAPPGTPWASGEAKVIPHGAVTTEVVKRVSFASEDPLPFDNS